MATKAIDYELICSMMPSVRIERETSKARQLLKTLLRTVVCFVGGCLIALGGCATEESPPFEVFNYSTYSCAGLRADEKFWMGRLDYLSSPQAATEQQGKLVEEEGTLLGLLKSLTGTRDRKQLERDADLARMHMSLIETTMVEKEC